MAKRKTLSCSFQYLQTNSVIPVLRTFLCPFVFEQDKCFPVKSVHVSFCFWARQNACRPVSFLMRLCCNQEGQCFTVLNRIGRTNLRNRPSEEKQTSLCFIFFAKKWVHLASDSRENVLPRLPSDLYTDLFLAREMAISFIKQNEIKLAQQLGKKRC